ncbi:FK506-binding protein 15 [Protopterus annectens]|uniref:FK506-binding protein 15 n=1 Tax=Protopterus annectens TaxID=7888 RepID=UPI001CFC3D18|nr:FK506-binding protein 15 [Protopterus annectens]
MMFGGDEDDADFLSPTGGAKLASLFSLDQTVLGQGNESFQYTAPKQPKKGQAPTGQNAQKSGAAPAPLAVLYACAVHAYRYVNGQYVKQGKLGTAVLGNHTTKEVRCLLLRKLAGRLSAARVVVYFFFQVQPNNYSSFYDDQRQNWSIMFESEKSAMEFGKQVCLAKCNTAPLVDSVLIQELIPGEGQVVENGDSLEVAYTGWLYQSNSFGQMFDSNVNKDKLLRLKLGSNKLIKGWEEGMAGMKKGGKRLIIIPPALAYGAQGVAGRIPPDSTLIFEVEVKRVKFAKEAGSDKQSVGSCDSATPSPVPVVETLLVEPGMTAPSALPPKPGEPLVRVKSNSLSDQIANPDAAKAKLISRMAKMGQPMLPFITGQVTAQPDSSDSEMEDPTASRGVSHPAAPPTVRPQPHPVQMMPSQMPTHAPQQPVTLHASPSSALLPVSASANQTQGGLPENLHSFQPYTAVQYNYPHGAHPSSQLQPVGQLFPAQPPQYQVPAVSGDVTSFLMTEARQHNTEIRMAVNKVADKIEQLASKVDEMQKTNAGNATLLPGISSVTMETSMILHNIQRIIQENERLKQEIFEKSSKIEDQNVKISELIQRNQRYVEQSNMLMEQRNDSLKMTTEHTQSRVLQAEQEKVKVAEQLTAATSQVSRLQLELTAHQQKEVELRKQLTAALQESERHGTLLNTLQSQLAELQETSEHAQTQYKTEKQSRKQLEGKVSTLEEELADVRAEKEILKKNLSERKKNSVTERQRMEEEMEEARKSYQEELENLRQVLKKSRASTDQTATEQLSIVQAEIESQWQMKCDRLLAAAKEQHALQQQELSEQRDAVQQKVSQLEEKLVNAKQLLESKEALLSAALEKTEQLEAVREKYSLIQSRMTTMKEHYDSQIQQLEAKVTVEDRKTQSSDTAEEVKKIMNGVFQSLRSKFNMEDSYSGKEVLGVIMATIKTVTLQLLDGQQDSAVAKSDSEDEDEEEEEEVEEEPEQEVKIRAEVTQLEAIPKETTAEGTEEILVPAQPQSRSTKTVTPTQTEITETTMLRLHYDGHQQSAEKLESDHEIKVQEIPTDSLSESMKDSAPDFKEQRVSELTEELPHEALSHDPPGLNSTNDEHLTDKTEQDKGVEVKDQQVENTSVTLASVSECAETVKSEIMQSDKSRNSQITTYDTDGLTKGIFVQTESELLTVNQKKEKLSSENETSPSISASDPLKEILKVPEGQPFEDKLVSDKNGLNIVEIDSDQGHPPSETKAEQKQSSAHSSLFGDDDDESLFKSATPKTPKSVITTRLEDDEDDVCLKGRPPPAPLFADEDDDDLDWLG